MRHIGLIGGTFDPVHNGHLLLAQFARERIPLDEVRFVPAADPPHKTNVLVSPRARVEMVSLAISGLQDMFVSTVELERSGKSYTVDTIKHFCLERPNDSIYLIIGADNVEHMSTWYDPDRIFDLCKVVVGTRSAMSFTVDSRFSDRMELLETPSFEISSSEIRARLKAGLTIRGMVPECVEDYINERGLYTTCI